MACGQNVTTRNDNLIFYRPPHPMSKTFQAAIIIQPPLDQWQQIQIIRKAHDKAYQRWMPHVGCAMCWPFGASLTVI